MILKEVVNSIQSETSSTNRSRNDFGLSQIESLVWIHPDKTRMIFNRFPMSGIENFFFGLIQIGVELRGI